MATSGKAVEPIGIHRRVEFVPDNSLKIRFNDKVGPPDANGCILWAGAMRNGYGAIKFQGHVLGAHVVAYVLEHGSLPAGKIVTHDCDNRACVNPAHLSAGTFTSNVREMFDRRRVHKVRGEAARHAKLTVEKVLLIHSLHEVRGLGRDRICRIIGLSESCISNVLDGRTWSHISKPSAEGMQAILKAFVESAEK